jgi:putative spermidine/putrescine transport system substrate-binding protein
MPNLLNIVPLFKDSDGIGINMGYYTVGIEYNTKVFKDRGFAAPTSWLDLWDPKYKGHVSVLGWSVAQTQAFLASIAKMVGGSESNTDSAFAKIQQLKPNLLTAFADPAQLDNSLTQGDTWITYNASVRVVSLSASGAPVAFVIPKEGAAVVTNTMDVTAHSANPAAAEAFINHMLSADTQAVVATKLGYAPVVKNVPIPPELKDYASGDASRYVVPNWDVLVSRGQELAKAWAAST